MVLLFMNPAEVLSFNFSIAVVKHLNNFLTGTNLLNNKLCQARKG